MKEIECPSCGEKIPDDSRYCDMCGSELLQCVNCGTLGTDRFCPECGKPMIARNPEKAPTPTPTNPVKPVSPQPTEPEKPKKIVLKARKGGFIIEPEHEAVIGRQDSPYAELLSPLSLISRRHGKFVKRGSRWYIVDFGSTNGTLVNDMELAPDEPARFDKGDVVDIGTYIFDVIEV